MRLNFQLFNNFKDAVEQSGLELKKNKSFYSVTFENGRYIYCWTPLNKIQHVLSYLKNADYDRALDHLKDNFADFHLEIDSRGHQDQVAECFIRESWNPNITTAEIVKVIEILQDDSRLEKKRLLASIEFTE